MPDSEFFENAICGVGPAGMGPIVCAYQDGLLDKVLDKGIVLIDRRKVLGVGSFGEYHITANSLGKVFLECLEKIKKDPSFFNLINHKYVKKLKLYSEKAPDLPVVAEYLGLLSEYLINRIKIYRNCSILRSTNILDIQQKETGLYAINIETNENGRSHTRKIYTHNIILNLGGQQSPNNYLYRSLWDDFNLSSYQDRVIPSGALLKLSPLKLNNVVSTNFSKIVVVGGSHSAFSVTMKLAELYQKASKIKREIFILHRNDIRLFFNDKQDAQEAHYLFDVEKDICKLSGRVNRFSGLRYNAFDFASKLLKTGQMKEENCEINLHRISINPSLQQSKFLKNLFEMANLIIPCFGYQANLVPIYDNNGHLIPIRQELDGLYGDDKGRVYTKDNYLIPNIYSYGLGSGLKRSEKIGGELSFQGRLDGVWLYQNDIGRIILEQML